VQSDVRQLKLYGTAAGSEQLDRFDRATELLRQRATAYRAGHYETGSANFENGTALLHETDLTSRPARTCDRAGGNRGRLGPLGSGVRGRTHAGSTPVGSD
jgi:hypothetical protein